MGGKGPTASRPALGLGQITPAAGDEVVVTSDPRGAIRSEEGDHLSEVGDFSWAAQRNLCKKRFHRNAEALDDVLANSITARGNDRTGSDDIDANLFGREFLS